MRTGRIGLITQSSGLTVQVDVVAASHKVAAWLGFADAFGAAEGFVDWLCIGRKGKALEERVEARGWASNFRSWRSVAWRREHFRQTGRWVQFFAK